MRRTIILSVAIISILTLFSFADVKKIEPFPARFDQLVFDEARGVYVTTRGSELWEAKNGVWTNLGAVVPKSLHRFLVYDRHNERVVLIARKIVFRDGSNKRSRLYYVWELKNSKFVEKGYTGGLKSINDGNIYQALYCESLNQIVIVAGDRLLAAWDGSKWNTLSKGWSEEGYTKTALYDKDNDEIVVVWYNMYESKNGANKYQTWTFNLQTNTWEKKNQTYFKKFDFSFPDSTKFAYDTEPAPIELAWMMKDSQTSSLNSLISWTGQKWKQLKGSKNKFEYSGDTKNMFPLNQEFIVSVVNQDDAFVTWTWDGSKYTPYRMPWCNVSPEYRSRIFYNTNNQRAGLVAQRQRYITSNSKINKVYDISVFWFDGSNLNSSGWATIDILGKRRGHQVVFDAQNDRIILFGGRHLIASSYDDDYTLTNYGDTWEFKGKTWRNLNISGPNPRSYAAMAANTRNGDILLYGGTSEYYDHGVLREGVKYDDTWIFKNNRWEKVAGPGPEAQEVNLLAYDPVRDRYILTGSGGGTWQFVNGSWNKQSDKIPPVYVFRNTDSLFYDSGRGAIVYISSSTANAKPAWKWTGSSWESIEITGKDISFSYPLSATYDEHNKRIIGFDGAIYYITQGKNP